MTGPPTFLSLPPEIRDEIYQYLVVKPTNTITMLENHNCFQNEVSAAQPAISRVNKQTRDEVLPMFYKSNVFLAELSNATDLDTGKSWLDTIGDANAACLRRLAVCGWTKVAFGQRMCRLWIRVVFNLGEGSLEMDGNKTTANEHRHIFKNMQSIEDYYRGMVTVMKSKGERFGVASLSRLMEKFHDFCTDHCSKGCRDVDGECRV